MVRQSEGYDIRRLIALILDKIWLVVVCAVLVGTSSFLYTKFAVPLKYESYTSLYVRSDRSGTASDNSVNEVDMNSLNLSKSLVSTYTVVLQSNSVMDKIGNLLVLEFDEETLSSVFTIKDGKISTGSIKSCFTMTAINNTEAMRISAVTTNPEISAALCNLMAQVAPDFLIRVVGAGSVEIIDPAVANYTPISANIPKNTMLGALVGAVIAIGFIFVIDFFDDTVKDPAEISDLFDKAVLGEVQNIVPEGSSKRKKNKNGNSDRAPRKLLTDKNIPFSVTESYKSIRTNILFSLGTSNNNVIAVSSANPSEGKSTASANIAIAFAQTSSRVLLIDADMRKPVQHKSFRLSNTKGLSTLIVNMSTFDESIKKTSVENLDVLTSGPMPPNPSELLASAHYTEMLNKLSKVYDYIIIDTPPINVVSDAMIMSNNVSGILLVLKYGSTTYGDVSEAMKQFELANTNLLGFVLNDIESSGRGSYYRYSYKYSYKYSADYAYRNSSGSDSANDDDEDDD